MNGFKVGDIVQIKEWDEMEKDFGLISGYDAIDSIYPFTKEMKFLCGQIFQINRFKTSILGNTFIHFEETDKPYGFLINEYAISMDVLKCIRLENG